jgi:hypothetical protein
MDEVCKVFFFAGAEATNNKFNVFTSSFIKMMDMIVGDNFRYVTDIYFSRPMRNVIWALNNAQRPLCDPSKSSIVNNAFQQIVKDGFSHGSQLLLISSSSGSVVAAQTACYLAAENKKNKFFSRPFNIALGSSMISTRSQLYEKLLEYQQEKIIGTILHDEMQDDGDNTAGMGGTSRFEAYLNAFGIIFPVLSGRYNGPSFLNKHPENGHIHRQRSMTIQKSIDYTSAIMIKYALAGGENKKRAENLIHEISNNTIILS